MPSWRSVWLGWMKVRPDVGVLDEALAEGDAGLLGVARRGRGARLGHRDDQVGVDGELAGQLAAHLDARLVDAAAGDRGVGAGEVDVLEDAALALGLGEGVRAQAVVVDDDHLAGLDLAHHAGADGGQRGVLGGHHPAAVEAAEHQRADALRVAGGVQRVLVHPHEAEGAAQHRQHLERPLLERGVGVVGQQRGDQAGVVGRRSRAGRAGRARRRGRAASATASRSSWVLIRLPLWPSAIEPSAVGRKVGWAFCQVARAGRGVARVADREVALERVERRLVEDLRDQAHVLVDQDLAAVADRDAGRLLAAVLQGVEPEVGQLGDVLPGRPDTEDAAGVLRALVVRVEGGGQPAVATRRVLPLLWKGTSAVYAPARGLADSPPERPAPKA